MSVGELLVAIEGRGGRLRLNRPKAIHALTMDMCEGVIEALEAWRADPAVEIVLIDHAPAPDGDPKLSRGFCSGGDIRLLAASGAGDGVEGRAFFHLEYRMNHRLFAYAKPIVAFMDGVTMGGGVGLSQPARYRVATENTRLAMPETGIGLFTDVGGGWYLARLAGRIGVYLALTGARIDGAECLALGLATHYLPADRLDQAKQRIAAAPADVETILTDLAEVPPQAKILAQQADIDRLFASDRLETIFAALEADDSAFATETLQTLRTKSPQTMKVCLRLVENGARMSNFADEMAQEYAVACHILQRHDFIEGVRALIIDKDQAPRWDPATPEAVTDHLIDQIFAPLPADQAWTAA